MGLIMDSFNEIENLCEETLGQIIPFVETGYTLKEANKVYSGLCLLAYRIKESEIKMIHPELAQVESQLESLILEIACKINREPPDWMFG